MLNLKLYRVLSTLFFLTQNPKNKGGQIIDNLQIDNLQIDNGQIDNRQIDNQHIDNQNLQIDNLQITFIS